MFEIATGSFEFQEDKEFDRLINNTTFDFYENERFDKMFDIAKGSFTNKFEKFITNKFEQNMDNQEAQCPVLRGGCKEFKTFA